MHIHDYKIVALREVEELGKKLSRNNFRLRYIFVHM